LWVELTFGELTAQEKSTFEKYVRADGTMCVRKTARWGNEGGPTISYNGYVQEPTLPYLHAESAATYTSRDAAESLPFYRYLPESGRLSRAQVEEAQRRYIVENHASLEFVERLESVAFLGQRNVAAGLLPDIYLVPAVRDLDDEARVKSTTIFGRLLTRAIEDMTAGDERFIKLRSDMESVVRSLNRNAQDGQRPEQLAALELSLQEELQDWGVDVSIEVSPPDISKIFELGTSLRIDDGYDSVAQRKGHGLQRAVLLGFAKAWAKVLRQRSDNLDVAARRASESSDLWLMRCANSLRLRIVKSCSARTRPTLSTSTIIARLRLQPSHRRSRGHRFGSAPRTYLKAMQSPTANIAFTWLTG
jgi:CRISPR-associated exonuclease Cas4